MTFWRRWRTAAAARSSEPPAAFDLPVISLADIAGPGVSANAIRFPPHLLDRFDPVGIGTRRDEWAMPLAELIALAALCARLRPRRLFEIGTYTGIATLVLAENAPDDAEIITLDLDPASRRDHVHGLGVGGFPDFIVGAHLRGQAAAAKVRQCLGDSRTFDFEPFRGRVDFALIDADHTYEFVKRDTERALAMRRPGGTIVWDDYVWTPQFPECAGVTRCVNELARQHPVRRVAGTRLAILVDDQRPDEPRT